MSSGTPWGCTTSMTIPRWTNLDAVMNDPYTNKTPTAEDIAQLKAIYALHDSSPHSP